MGGAFFFFKIFEPPLKQIKKVGGPDFLPKKKSEKFFWVCPPPPPVFFFFSKLLKKLFFPHPINFKIIKKGGAKKEPIRNQNKMSIFI